MLVHESNLARKEQDGGKYSDDESKAYLAEIRTEYDKWHAANSALVGPTATITEVDRATVDARVAALAPYKDFLDQQHFAEHFHSKSNLHSTVLEQFIYYLFRDLAGSFGPRARIGKAHAFKDIFFQPPSYKAMLEGTHLRLEKKDHDFIIGASIDASLAISVPEFRPYGDGETPPAVHDARAVYGADENDAEDRNLFDLPAVAIECKTYLDKSMLEACSRSASELKARCPNARYVVVMEWLKLSENINLMKYEVDQIYVLRRQRNTDQEDRFHPDYEKLPIDPAVVWHLFEFVRSHLITDWEGGVAAGLERGWLI